MWRRQNTIWIKQVSQKMKWELWRGSSCPQCLTIVASKDGARKLGFMSQWQGMWKVLSFLNSVMMNLLEKTKYRSLIKKSMMLCLEDLQERERKTVKKLKKALKMVAKGAPERTKRHKLAQWVNHVDKLLVIQFGIVICRTWSWKIMYFYFVSIPVKNYVLCFVLIPPY